MALAPCKECGKEISTEATVCPHCGKKNPTSRGLVVGKAGGCLLVVIVLGIIGSLSESTRKHTAAPPTAAQVAAKKVADSVDLELTTSVELCHRAALKRLKSPSTANFLDDSTYQKDLGKGRSHIQLQVDAQNSFGGVMRTTVDCKTRLVAGNVVLTAFDSWQR